MQKILDEHQVEGAVYGESSTFHVFFGKVPNGLVKGLSAAQIRALPKETVQAYRAGLRQRGVDNMSYLCGVTSLAHTAERSDERRGGKECVSTCRTRGSRYH